MKKLIILLCFCCIIPIAYSIGENINITQMQLDSINPLTFDLNCSYDGYSISYLYGFPHKVVYKYSCINIEERHNQSGIMWHNYITYREYGSYPIKLLKLYECVRNNNLNRCSRYVRDMVQLQFDQFVENIRIGIYERQTPPFEIGSFNFTVPLNTTR